MKLTLIFITILVPISWALDIQLTISNIHQTITNFLTTIPLPFDPGPTIQKALWDPIRPFFTHPISPMAPFNIPLFILDTRHPWILQHKDLLNSQPQIEAALCTTNPNHPALLHLKHLSPKLTPPADLYHSVSIGGGIGRPGYENMIDRLNELLSCPAAIRDLQSLEINLSLMMAEATGLSYRELYGIDTTKLNKTNNPRDYSWYDRNMVKAEAWARARFNADSDYTKTLLIRGSRGAVPQPRTIPSSWLPTPPFDLSTLLAQVLNSSITPDLTSLSWNMPCQISHLIERDLYANGFGHDRLKLPNIKHLRIGDYVEYMIPLAPNLESLSIRNHDSLSRCMNIFRPDGPSPDMRILWALEEATTKYPGLREKITRFEDHGRRENTKYLLENSKVEIINLLPSLKSLHTRGSILPGPPTSENERWNSWGDDYYTTRSLPRNVMERPLRNYLRMISSRLPSLRVLHLPAPNNLKIGYDPGAQCGNAYFGEGGQAYLRQVKKRRYESVDLITRILMEEIPGLQEFSLEGYTPVINRTVDVADCDGYEEGGKDGGLKGMLTVEDIIWPWTGKG